MQTRINKLEIGNPTLSLHISSVYFLAGNAILSEVYIYMKLKARGPIEPGDTEREFVTVCYHGMDLNSSIYFHIKKSTLSR